MVLKDLAAFDPKRLAMMLQNMPEGTIVFGILATGPMIAAPRPVEPDKPVPGGLYYCEDRVEVWTGSTYLVTAELIETTDGRPELRFTF